MERFFWGLSTSAFQMEGHVENDMTAWEKQGGFRQDGKNPVYGHGADHWRRWRDDFKLFPDIGINSYRFSLEWARIEPNRGQYDENALDSYEQMLDTLIGMGLQPFLTLHHFTHPGWFHAETPWVSKAAGEVFYAFAEKIVKRFASKVAHWITFNEPLVWVLAAYGDAKFPPGESDMQRMMQAYRNILKSHARIYDLIKRHNPNARVGLAKHFIIFKPGHSWFGPDRGLAGILHAFFNEMTLDAFKTNRLKFHLPLLIDYNEEITLDDKIDFWGINYYYRMHASFRFNIRNPLHLFFKDETNMGLTDMGWEIYPQGLGQILELVNRQGKEIFITENGIATEDETIRIRFISAHIREVFAARQKGIPVTGYFYWSFLDNYEWLEGMDMRFGLVHVNYDKSDARCLKDSAFYFARLISSYTKENIFHTQF